MNLAVAVSLEAIHTFCSLEKKQAYSHILY